MDLIEYVKNEYWLLSEHAQRGLESADGLEYKACVEWLAQHKLTNFIEIGSAWGASFHLWSTIIDGKKISVDALPNSVPYQYPSLTNEHVEIRNSKWNSHFSDVYSVLGNSHEQITVDRVRDILNNQLVDWLYIDAEHSYESAKTEFNLYKQFVRKNGFVGFHDIQLISSDGDTSQPGCGIFWQELKNSGLYECIEFEGRDTKIGVLKFAEG
jgi:hypothetical protein